MSEKYKFYNPGGLYFVTCTVIDWIDLFTRKGYSDIILQSLQFCQQKKQLRIHAWVIMPSHFHATISKSGSDDLPAILRDFKKYTSQGMIQYMEQANESRRYWLLPHFSEAAKKIKRVNQYKVWQDGNHPVELTSNKMMDDRLNYIHNNPVKAGYVLEPHHYALSSAIDYCGGKGFLNIEMID